MTGTSRPGEVAAIVLAGGRASRFGSDKLAAELDGRAVLEHALEAAAAVASVVVVVASPEGPLPVTPPGVRVIRDLEPFGGPLAGLLGGLESISTATALVVAGDMPRLVPVVLEALVEEVLGGSPGAVLEVPGRVQPLPLALRVEAGRATGRQLLDAGERSLRSLVAALPATAVPAERWRALDPAGVTLTDIDRPEDLAR